VGRQQAPCVGVGVCSSCPSRAATCRRGWTRMQSIGRTRMAERKISHRHRRQNGPNTQDPSPRAMTHD
jgi:coenzyme F420-reducing hydrogenase gamma subunit